MIQFKILPFKDIAHSLFKTFRSQKASPSTRLGQLWIINNSQFFEWLPILDELKKNLKFQSKPPALVLDTKGSLAFCNATRMATLERRETYLRLATQISGPAGFLLWSGYMYWISTGTQSYEKALTTWNKDYPLQETAVFLSFQSFFSSLFTISLGYASATMLSLVKQDTVLAYPHRKYILVNSDITPEILIGTEKEPGLLLQTMHGFLVIPNDQHLIKGAKSTLETLVSNYNTFEFGVNRAKISYGGQIIIGSTKASASFSDVALKSGRLLFLDTKSILQTIQAPPLENRAADDSVNCYTAIHSTMTDSYDPFYLLIGRAPIVTQIKKHIDSWIENWQHKFSPRSQMILLSDHREDEFGQGKSYLAEEAVAYAQKRAQEEGLLIPGVQLIRKSNGRVDSSPLITVPSVSMSAFDIKMSAAGVIFLGVLGYLFRLEADGSNHVSPSQSRDRLLEFYSEACLATLAIGVIFGALNIKLNYQKNSTSPCILRKPDTQFSVAHIISPTQTADWLGIKTESGPPQTRYISSEKKQLYGLNHIMVIESGAIDPLKSDTTEEVEAKKEMERTLAAFKFSRSFKLAGTGPEIPLSQLFIVSFNRTLDQIDPSLKQQSLCISMQSVVPYRQAYKDSLPQRDSLKFFTLLVKNNNAQGGLPWSDTALKMFEDAIHFKGETAIGTFEYMNDPALPNRVLFLRHYFQDLLPRVNQIARLNNHKQILASDFTQGWHAFLAIYQDQITKNLTRPKQVV